MNVISISPPTKPQPKARAGQYWRHKSLDELYLLCICPDRSYALYSLSTGLFYCDEGNMETPESVFGGNKADFELIEQSFTVYPEY